MDKISALMDGELDEQQAREQFARLNRDESLADSWHTFHRIGDALRGDRELSRDFSSGLAARLKDEPTVLAPRHSPARRFATYALSAAASLSAIALVGWVALGGDPQAPQPAQVAKAIPAPVAPVNPVVVPAVTLVPPPQLASVPNDGTMNEYLIAHQGSSPSTSIQGVAPYIRGVSATQLGESR
jgi:sigma-E factor negative regulatory protein RseA